MRINVPIAFRLGTGRGVVRLNAGIYEIVPDEFADYERTIGEEQAAFLVSQNLAKPVTSNAPTTTKTKRKPANKKRNVPKR